MNKTNLMIAAFAAIALSACADNKDAGPKGNTEDLNFTVQKGTPLSASEISNITALIKQVVEVDKNIMTAKYADHLVPDNSVSDTDKAERNKEYDELSSDQKAELERAKKVCVISERADQSSGNKEMGKSTTVTTASITGSDCPVQYKEKTTVIPNLDIKENGTYSGTIKLKNSISTERTDSRSAPLPYEITSQKVSVNASGTVQGSADSSRNYNAGAMTMDMNITDFGSVKVDGNFKMLNESSMEKNRDVMILQANLTAGGRTYKLSMRTQSNHEGETSEMEVYLNGTKIDASALEALK